MSGGEPAADGPARLLTLDHVTVRSADLARTERFYGDLLGLQVGPRPAIAIPGRWFYVGGMAVLHVLAQDTDAGAAADTVGGPGAPGAEPGRAARGAIDHFALGAVDRPAFERRLQAAGVPFRSRRLADTGTWQVFLTDPDGVCVELNFAADPAAAAGGDASS